MSVLLLLLLLGHGRSATDGDAQPAALAVA